MCPLSLVLLSPIVLLRVRVFSVQSSFQIFWARSFFRFHCPSPSPTGQYESYWEFLYCFSSVFRSRSLDLKSIICARNGWFADVVLGWMFVHVLFSLFTTDRKYVQLLRLQIWRSHIDQVLEKSSGLCRGHFYVLCFLLIDSLSDVCKIYELYKWNFMQ